MAMNSNIAGRVARLAERYAPAESGPQHAVLVEQEAAEFGMPPARCVLLRLPSGRTERMTPEAFKVRYPHGKVAAYVRVQYEDAGT